MKYIYGIIHRFYSVIKNEIMLFAEKWMELEIIRLSEMNLLQKDKYYTLSLIYGI
jgi:hypothetical protein